MLSLFFYEIISINKTQRKAIISMTLYVYTHTIYILLLLVIPQSKFISIIFSCCSRGNEALPCTCIFREAIVFCLTRDFSDSGDSVRWSGGVDPCCAPCWGEGGCCWASSVRPASPHLPPSGCRAGSECCATALWHPSRHQATGPATLLARSKGKDRREEERN